MRYIAVLSLIALAACASKQAAPSTAPAAGGTKAADVGVIEVNDPRTTVPGDGVIPVPLEFPADIVWKALPIAFDSLGIPLVVYDMKSHLIGNQGMKLHVHLGKVALSKYIDCGVAQNIPSADSYEVYLSVVSHVRFNDKGGSDLITKVNAAARPMTFAQAYSRCASKGELEKRLVTLVKAVVLASR